MYATPSGAKIFPSTPVILSTGKNTSATTKVAYTTALRTSSDASRITSNVGLGFALARFPRRRRKMFSTSMTASSTTSPIAIASPPSVIVLSVAPIRFSTTTAISNERGIAVSEMNALRRL